MSESGIDGANGFGVWRASAGGAPPGMKWKGAGAGADIGVAVAAWFDGG